MDVSRSGTDGIWFKYMTGAQVNDLGRLTFCDDRPVATGQASQAMA